MNDELYNRAIQAAAAYAVDTGRFSGEVSDYQEGAYIGMFDLICEVFGMSMNRIDSDIRAAAEDIQAEQRD